MPTYKSNPSIGTSNPTGGAQDVPRNTDIAVSFNMPMDQETINSDNFSVSSPSGGRSGTITYDPLGKTATFTPDALFQPGETIDVNISQHVSNLWGVQMGLDLDWTFEITTATDVQTPDPGVLPGVFALHQNYPNPFNAETQIRFSLAAPGPVGLRVYNMRGQLVKTLVNGDLPAGQHQALWDGSDQNGSALGSGVYFYRLEAEDRGDVKRMVLVR